MYNIGIMCIYVWFVYVCIYIYIHIHTHIYAGARVRERDPGPHEGHPPRAARELLEYNIALCYSRV